jgi:hypothetical protein
MKSFALGSLCCVSTYKVLYPILAPSHTKMIDTNNCKRGMRYTHYHARHMHRDEMAALAD